MSNNFDKHLRQHYSDQSLAPQVMQRLLEMQSIQANVNSNLFDSLLNSFKKFFIGPQRVTVIALCLMLLFAPLFVLNNEGNTQQDLLSNIAKEVALNHHKQLPSDFVTDSYSELSTVMDKLDFTINKSMHEKLAGYQLTGARYCSLQGQIAGQLKLRHDSGELHTLYVTRLSEKFNGLTESEQEIGGLKVSSWQADGLFFSLAR